MRDIVLSVAAAVVLAGAARAAGPPPALIAYQGQVTAGGSAYSGTGYFKLAIVDGAGTATWWTHDGTPSGEPAGSLALAVADGVFTVVLGDTAIMEALTGAVFAETDSFLRVWFSTDGVAFTHLTPDRRITAVAYALRAAAADNPGPTGPTGPVGPPGATGPPGPQGLSGPAGLGCRYLSSVLTFPPGGQITLMTASIHTDSLLLVNYVNGSKGNACVVEDQGEGWATFSGSPNKQFRFTVLDD